MTKYFSSNWTLEFSAYANKELHKLERHLKQRIVDHFQENILTQSNPRTKGKPLYGKLGGH